MVMSLGRLSSLSVTDCCVYGMHSDGYISNGLLYCVSCLSNTALTAGLSRRSACTYRRLYFDGVWRSSLSRSIGLFVGSDLHCVPKKSHFHIFAKYWPILKILSTPRFVNNLQYTDFWNVPRHLNRVAILFRLSTPLLLNVISFSHIYI